MCAYLCTALQSADGAHTSRLLLTQEPRAARLRRAAAVFSFAENRACAPRPPISLSISVERDSGRARKGQAIETEPSLWIIFRFCRTVLCIFRIERHKDASPPFLDIFNKFSTH